MKIISLNKLSGVPNQYENLLKEVLESKTSQEKLIVGLYFMSDLDDSDHHLDEIESNVRKLYYDKYINTIKDFQSSNIRGVTNKDVNRLKEKQKFEHLTDTKNIDKGYWKNNETANKEAEIILKEAGIMVVKGLGIEGAIYISSIPAERLEFLNKEGSKEYKEVLIKLRRGQQKFRNDLIKAYNNTCCISGEQCTDVIEAAHIQEYINKDSNFIPNGLLLRCDWHKLYDKNLIYIDENYIIHISSKINSDYYKSYDNKKLNLEVCLDERNYPNKSALKLREENFIK